MSRLPDLAIRRHRLDNGLQIVLQPDPALPLVAVNLWYHVGSKDERPGRTGFAHLFEHMLFQGSRHVGTNEHFAYVQQAGGVANGSTWFDRTNYYETVPSQHLDLALWLESDRMGYLLSALDQEKLDRQRDVVLNERRQVVDNQPYGRAGEHLWELAFPSPHPYHWPVLGYPEDLAAASLDDVEEFFRTYYTPGNAVLTLVGDFEPDEAIAAVGRYFGEIPTGPRLERGRWQLPRHRRQVRETMADRVELARLYCAWVIPAYGERDWYTADLLSSVLAEGKSSPVYQDLVYRRQLAHDVGIYVQPSELASTFLMIATARPDVDLDVLEAALGRHLELAASQPPAEADLERARHRTRIDYLQQLESLDQRADLLSQFTTYFDDPDRLLREPDRYSELQAADLEAFAAAHLRADRRVTLRVVPGS